MQFIDESFWNASVTAGDALGIQPEIGPTVASLEWTKMGWGYWDLTQAVPPVDMYKWLEPRHSTAM